MIYGFDSRIRYSEVDLHLHLTMGSVIDYFQDCSTFHSEHIGLGVGHLDGKDRAWVLSSWQIVCERFPRFGETVRIETWPYDFKGFYGSRNFSMKDAEGNRIIYANSLWVYMDTKNGRPAKVDPEEIEGYILEEKLPMDYAPRKLSMPKEMKEEPGFVVVKNHLDTNYHVNNAQYVKMAEEYLPEGFRIGQLRAEYRKSAKLHDRIIPRVSEENGTYTVALTDEGGVPYVVMIFDPYKEK